MDNFVKSVLSDPGGLIIHLFILRKRKDGMSLWEEKISFCERVQGSSGRSPRANEGVNVSVKLSVVMKRRV